MIRYLALTSILAIGCSSANFEIAAEQGPVVDGDTGSQLLETASETDSDSGTPTPDTGLPPLDSGDGALPDSGPPADTGKDSGVPDTYVPPVDTGAPDARIDHVFPAIGDSWTSTASNKLAVPGDSCYGSRTFTGGQTKGSGVLDISGEGTMSAQLLVTLRIDGIKVWERKVYPADSAIPFSFTLSTPLTTGAHTLSWYAEAIYSCPGGSCGYLRVPNGTTTVRFE